MSRPFAARYRGECASCGWEIDPGQPVRYDGDDLVHDDCDGDAEPAEQPACPSCWTVHAGECM